MNSLLEQEVVIGERTDEELFADSLKHPRLFAQLLDRYQAAFLRKAFAVMKDEDAAEDVVQETFTRIYLKGNSFTDQGAGSFKSWGYRILLNVSYTHYGRRKRTTGVELSEELLEILPDHAADTRERREVADYVASVLARMPDNLADVLGRFLLQGMSQEEIAAQDGVSVGAVKTKVYRAKEAFRRLHTLLA